MSYNYDCFKQPAPPCVAPGNTEATLENIQRTLTRLERMCMDMHQEMQKMEQMMGETRQEHHRGKHGRKRESGCNRGFGENQQHEWYQY
jgi:hypothetical protein